MIKSESIAQVSSAFVKAQSEMGNATKGTSNPFFKSKFADLNAIREASLPVLSKHGLSIAQPTVYIDGKKFVQTTLIHESGEFIGGLTEILSVKETDAQAQGSGISYARRYGLQSLLCIGAEDDDGESAIGRPKANNYTKPVEKKPEVVKTSTNTSTGEVNNIMSNGQAEAPKKTGGFGQKKPVVETKVETTEDNGWD